VSKQITFDQLPDLEPLTEVRLSKVYNAFASANLAVGIITAYQQTPSTSPKDNEKYHRHLAATLRNAGFGIVWMDGAWQGDPQTAPVPEVAVLVTADQNNQYCLFEALRVAATNHGQGAFVFQKAGARQPIGVFGAGGEEIRSFVDVRLDDIFESYTSLRSDAYPKRSFVYEAVRTPVGFFGKLAGLSD
jgi:hypothetical protein